MSKSNRVIATQPAFCCDGGNSAPMVRQLFALLEDLDIEREILGRLALNFNVALSK